MIFVDILLVALNASYAHVGLAVHSLAAACRTRGFSADVLELHINMPMDVLFEALCAASSKVIGFSLYIWNRELALKLAADIKRVTPEVSLILGGPEATFDAERLLAAPSVFDAVFLGEAEESLPEWLENRQAVVNGVRTNRQHAAEVLTFQQVTNLNKLPPPYMRDTLDNLGTGRMLYYESSRGCPFACSYCLSSATHGVRHKSVDKVIRELQALSQSGARIIKLVDRTFNAAPERATALLRFMAEDSAPTTYHLEITADKLTEEQLDLLCHLPKGKVQLEAGVQSTNPETLAAIGRQCDWTALRDNVRRIVGAGRVHVHADLIAGLPFEDAASLARSFDDVFSLHAHQVQLGFLKLLPGTKLREQATSWDMRARAYPPYEILETRWLNHRSLIEMKRVARAVESLYNTGRFQNTVSHLLENSSPFPLFVRLSQEVVNCYDTSNPFKIKTIFERLLAYGRHDDALREHLIIDWFASGQTGPYPEGLAPSNPAHMAVMCRELLASLRFWSKHFSDLPETDRKSVAKRLRFATLNMGEGNALYCVDTRQRDPVTGRFPLFAVAQTDF